MKWYLKIKTKKPHTEIKSQHQLLPTPPLNIGNTLLSLRPEKNRHCNLKQLFYQSSMVLKTNSSLLSRMVYIHVVFLLLLSKTCLVGTYTLWLSSCCHWQVSLHFFLTEAQAHILGKFRIQSGVQAYRRKKQNINTIVGLREQLLLSYVQLLQQNLCYCDEFNLKIMTEDSLESELLFQLSIEK